MWLKEAFSEGKSMETETITWLEILNKWKTAIEEILGSEEINKSKRPGWWDSQTVFQTRKLTISLRLFEIKKIYNKVQLEYVSHFLRW